MGARIYNSINTNCQTFKIKKVMYAKKLGETLSFMLREKLPVLIKGAPGIGKSDIVEQACRKLGYDLLITHPVVSDPTDYKGLPFLGKDDQAHFMPFGFLNQLINTTEPLVFFLDDLGQATPAVQSAVMQLLLARKINGHAVSKHVRFVAATNRREDRANVSGILEPVKSRFASILELEVKVDDWVQWAWANEMPSQLISFIQFRPELLSKFEATRDIENSPSPRTVAYVGKMLRAGLPSDIQFETIKGATGEGFATEFISYLKVYSKLPSIEEIQKHPRTTNVPDEMSSKYAIMGSIAEHVCEKTIVNFLVYLQRLGAEFAISAMKSLALHKPEVCKTDAFADWAMEHTDLIMG